MCSLSDEFLVERDRHLLISMVIVEFIELSGEHATTWELRGCAGNECSSWASQPHSDSVSGG